MILSGTSTLVYGLLPWTIVEGIQVAPSTALRSPRPPSLLRSKLMNWEDVPRHGIEKYFNQNMQSDHVPLLNCFETYSKWLPTREYVDDTGRVYLEHLCDFPFWTNIKDIATMAARLEAVDIDSYCRPRGLAKYAVAPSSHGKTSSILPAFLESTKNENGFDYYFYLACDNNGKNTFTFNPSELSTSCLKAEDQGAWFIFESLKLMLNAKAGPHTLSLDGVDPPSIWQTIDHISTYMNKVIPENKRILIHLDEYRMMCNLDTEQAAAFRRGAMNALARASSITLIVTYTAVPYEIAWERSSSMIRDPVPLPHLDISKAMLGVEELNFAAHHNVDAFDTDQKRLWAILRFRLAAKLLSSYLTPLHILQRGKNEIVDANLKKFLSGFHDLAKNTCDTTEAITACIDHTVLASLDIDETSNVNALELLLGIKDYGYDIQELVRENNDFVLINRRPKRLTSNLWKLLSLDDPNYPVYKNGRDRLAHVLTDTINTKDAESELPLVTPLQAAYTWTLSCRSARHGSLQFPIESSDCFDIKCQKIEPSRIFPGTQTSDYCDFSTLEENVIYYADEGNGKDAHPLCDVFFVSKKKRKRRIVMIDITESFDEDVAKAKETKLRNWIKTKRKRRFEFYGVVLAPFVMGDSTTKNCVTVVRDLDAQLLLGGLKQVATWLSN